MSGDPMIPYRDQSAAFYAASHVAAAVAGALVPRSNLLLAAESERVAIQAARVGYMVAAELLELERRFSSPGSRGERAEQPTGDTKGPR